MYILVLNAGSSSLKYELFAIQKNAEKHAQLQPVFKELIEIKKNDYDSAIRRAFDTLVGKKIITHFDEIKAIGHRVVHGGEQYHNATYIDKKVIKTIKRLCELAPLHNPPNLAGIEACARILPHTPQVAVFDTAFYQTLEPKAYLYPLSEKFYKKDGIRRYGFHGTSHKYMNEKIAEHMKKLPGAKRTLRVITCHLGNGSSVTATLNGKAIDTSMGFTPTEGIPMGTRCGDIDPAIPPYLMKKYRVSPDEVMTLLNKKSGLEGFSGISWDMRILHKKANKKNPRAMLTLDLLNYRIAKYIGGYIAALGGLDALAFTAGIGENAWYIRDGICEYLKFLGLTLNTPKNKVNAPIISTPKSTIKVFVIPAHEELAIAQETWKIIK